MGILEGVGNWANKLPLWLTGAAAAPALFQDSWRSGFSHFFLKMGIAIMLVSQDTVLPSLLTVTEVDLSAFW